MPDVTIHSAHWGHGGYMKTSSTFFSSSFISKIQNNCKNSPNLKMRADKLIEDASFWLSKSFDELWEMMYTPELKRSHMVFIWGCMSCMQKRCTHV